MFLGLLFFDCLAETTPANIGNFIAFIRHIVRSSEKVKEKVSAVSQWTYWPVVKPEFGVNIAGRSIEIGTHNRSRNGKSKRRVGIINSLNLI